MKDRIQFQCRTVVIGNQVIKVVGDVLIYSATFSGQPWYTNSFELAYSMQAHDFRWVSKPGIWDPQPFVVIR